MRVLLIGKGGREHALAWKIAQSKLLTSLYFWPGNAAMAGFGEALPVAATASFDELIAVAKERRIDLVVSGPEAPLSLGLADAFAAVGIPTFGPKQAAAQLESSKAFAKQVLREAGIPTAAYQVVRGEAACRSAAMAMLAQKGGVVLKASGLAAGKGVFVCESAPQVEAGLAHLYHSDMSAAASEVVLEEVLVGRECSYFVFLGVGEPLGLGFAVDFKRLEDGDQGPNTGGMGCYAPVPWLPADAEQQVHAAVIEPLLATLKKSGIDYQGCLYVGLMWSPEVGPQVIEFNVRLGDPEAQVLAVLDDRDWLAMMAATCGFAGMDVSVVEDLNAASRPDRAVAVVMAAASYPYGGAAGSSAALPGRLFAGRERSHAEGFVTAFAASVAGQERDGEFCMAPLAGRVLTVAARAPNFAAARQKAYEHTAAIAKLWPEARWRRDIALRMAQEEV